MGEPRRIESQYADIGIGRDSGVVVEYVARRKVIRVWGWHSTIVGIEGFEMPLEEFLAKLGIEVPARARKGNQG